LKPALHGEKPVANGPKYGTALLLTSAERSKTGSFLLTLDKTLLWYYMA
jgi:hypothetical protein